MVTPIPVESDFEGASIGAIRGVGKGGDMDSHPALFSRQIRTQCQLKLKSAVVNLQPATMSTFFYLYSYKIAHHRRSHKRSFIPAVQSVTTETLSQILY